MAGRVFLHVGTPKSGTTYLQDVLWSSAEVLQQHNLLLPGRRSTHRAAAQSITGRGVKRPGVPRDPDAAWRQLAAEVRDWPADVIISAELLAPATARQAAVAKSALGGAEIHVVLTARALSRQLPSAWQEQIKAGVSQPFDAFLDDVRRRSGPAGTLRRVRRPGNWFWLVQNLPAIGGRWAADLPPQHVHVVTAPPRTTDPTLLWRRYASVLDLEADAFPADMPRSKLSLGRIEAELLRRVHATRDPRFSETRRLQWTRALLAHQVLADRPGAQAIDLPNRARPWVTARMTALTEGIAAAGYDVVGSLDELTWDRQQKDTVTTAPVSDHEIQQAARWTIDRLRQMFPDRLGRAVDGAAEVDPPDGVVGILEMLDRIWVAGARPPSRASIPGRSRRPRSGASA